MSYEQWHALPDDAKKIWDMLSPEAKLLILRPFSTSKLLKPPYFGNRKPPPKQHQALPPNWTINKHEHDYLTSCRHELHGQDQPPEAAFNSAHVSSDGVTLMHEIISKPGI